MKKDYYFSHDYNAAKDEKMCHYLSIHGMSGYGLYWCLVELMHQSTDGKLNLKFLSGIAYQLAVDITLLQSCYNTAIEVGLFVTDGEKFWSERVLKNRGELEKKREAKAKAGKIGMQSRWAFHNSVITDDNSTITKHNKVKESKVNKSKEIQRAVLPDGMDGEQWERWIEYKRVEQGFKYKSASSEQTAANQAWEMCGRNNQVLAKMIDNSIANTWKGLFRVEANNIQTTRTDDRTAKKLAELKAASSGR